MKTILFLCTGNYYRSRFAEILFNTLVAQRCLPWRAESRGLGLEFGLGNLGPMSVATIWRLRGLGISLGGYLRFPLQAAEADLERAARIIALKEAEHRPLLLARFPAWVNQVEYWHIHDVDCGTVAETLDGIEREIRDLVCLLVDMEKDEEPAPRHQSTFPQPPERP